MSNTMRKFKRKEQRDFNYQEYARRKANKALARRRNEAMEKFHKMWKDDVEGNVPLRIRGIATMIPPKWYIKFATFIMDIYPNQDHFDALLAKGKMCKWPKWRMNANIHAMVALRWVSGMLLLRWILWIRGRVATLGISQKFFETKPGRLKMVIKYWGITIREVEVDV